MRIGEFETHPAADCFPLQTPERLQELADDIKANGLLEKVTLYKGQILDGRNRVQACLLADVEPVTEDWLGTEAEAVAFVRARNTLRRDLTQDQRRACLVELLDLETERRGRPAKADNQCREKGQTRDLLAAEMGEGVITAQKGISVFKKAPEVHEAVKQGTLTHNLAAKLADADPLDRAEVLDAIEGGTKPIQAMRALKERTLNAAVPDMPADSYGVIYCDPPWDYGIDNGISPKDHYPTMSLDAIKALPVGDLAAKDAALFMWATLPLLPQQLEVVTAWNFQYKTLFVWDKVRPNLGSYHRANVEVLIVATKGSCSPKKTERPDAVQTIERTTHSRKPEAFYDVIRGMYPRFFGQEDRNYAIELFRRGGKIPGWDQWGNEADND